MQQCQDDSLVYYRFDKLTSTENLIHGVFTRLGGISSPPFNTLNLGRTVGDTESAVRENYARICRTLGISERSLVTGYQVHSDHVVAVGRGDQGSLFPETDALTTGSSGVGLTLRFADCVPILFFDPVRKAIGIAHAGWKGTVNQISARVVETFQAEYRSSPSDIIACIGPSIGPCCYQVGRDVTEIVEATFPDARDLLISQTNGTVHFDLWAANRRILADAGVIEIEDACICTACRRDEFFSHRGDKGRTGRFGAFMALS